MSTYIHISIYLSIYIYGEEDAHTCCSIGKGVVVKGAMTFKTVPRGRIESLVPSWCTIFQRHSTYTYVQPPLPGPLSRPLELRHARSRHSGSASRCVEAR